MKQRISVKKRFFISNILMAISPVISLIFLSPFVRGIITILNKTIGSPILRENRPDFGEYTLIFNIIWICILVLTTVIVFIINRVLTHIMVKNIINPLETLSNGVRQIRDNNLSFRLDYKADDEFRPVCEVFNEMASRLEAMIAERQKDEDSRRELIAGISHDLRTPLTAIKAYLEGIETGVASTPEQQEKYFSTIKNKTADLEHIINQLFLFAKLDVNDFPTKLMTIDMRRFMADMAEDLPHEYEKRGLLVTAAAFAEDIPAQPIYARIDPALFRTVIVNILENSVKYKNTEQGHLEIGYGINHDADSMIEIRLTDDGPGVSRETLEKLFNVFYRADPSRNTKGSGLGLAISQKITNCMGGDISAALPAQGHGLSIIIHLPVANGTL